MLTKRLNPYSNGMKIEPEWLRDLYTYEGS